MKALLLTSSIFNIIVALFYLLFNNIVPGTILIVFSIFSFYIINTNQIEKNKDNLLIIGIINIFLNFISGILTIVTYGICPRKLKTEEEKKQSRLIMILNLGALLVTLSGFIFVITSNGNAKGVVNVIFLLVCALLFYFLYFLTNKKLNINSSSFIYLLISLIFFGFTYYSIGKYELFGNYFSIIGSGKNLFLMSNFIFDSLLTLIFYFHQKEKLFAYISVGFLCLSIIFLGFFCKFSILLIMLIFTVIISFYHFLKKDKNTNFIYTLFLIFTIISIVSSYENNYLYLSILTILQIINLFLFSKKLNTTYSKILTIIFSLICIFNFTFRLSEGDNVTIPLVSTLLATFYICTMITKIFEKDKNIQNFIMISINALLFIFYLYSFEIDITSHLFVTLSIMITNIIYMVFFCGKNIEFYLDPIKKFFSIISCLYVFSQIYDKFSFSLFASILIFFLLYLYTFVKEKELKSIYFSLIIITLPFAIIGNYDKVSAIIVLLETMWLNYSISKDKTYKVFLIPSYIFLLFITYILLRFTLLPDTYMSYSIVIFIYSILLVKNSQNKILYTIISYAYLLPFIGYINFLTNNSDIQIILYNMLGFYFLCITNQVFIKKDIDKIIVCDIVVIALLCMILFTGSIIVAIYAGIVSFILLCIGFQSKRYNHLFLIAIISTIVNILYSLKEVWLHLNIWIYLLFIGLLMIVFATYKELKNNKKDL